MSRPCRTTALVLSGLTLLFLARVLGQVLVACLDIPFLPPMSAWYSGLLPYPVLLPAQVLILLVQGKIDADAWRGRGLFAFPRPRAGRVLTWLAWAYAAAMLVRYAITRSHLIPVAFHLVLAGHLLVLGRAMSARDAPAARPRPAGGRAWPRTA